MSLIFASFRQTTCIVETKDDRPAHTWRIYKSVHLCPRLLSGVLVKKGSHWQELQALFMKINGFKEIQAVKILIN